MIATQNPIEYEGTFPLPEAQLDRFLVKLSIGYPRVEEENEILRRRAERGRDDVSLEAVIGPETLLAMREAVEAVHVDSDVLGYMVALAAKSRAHPKVVVGASPRGSIALLKLSRAWAAIHGRDFVIPDDAKRFCLPALGHRLMLDSSLWDIHRSEDAIVGEIVMSVPVPVLQERDGR